MSATRQWNGHRVLIRKDLLVALWILDQPLDLAGADIAAHDQSEAGVLGQAADGSFALPPP